jgi:outer membrane lipoprotein-sorting protein
MHRTAGVMLWLVAGTASAQDAARGVPASLEEKGRAIALEADRREAGFGDSVTVLTMEVVGADGRVRTRRLTWQTLEGTQPDAGDKSLTLFHEPRDIEGTAFLSHTYVDRPDDQWLYLPSLKRVKRISSANQSSAFVGSELAYEDLLSDEVERFDYRWLRDELCGASTCFVVERRPRYADSGYVKQVVWIDQAEYRAMRIEYYDLRERPLKTLTFDDYRRYLDRFWRAHRLRMENRQTGKVTILTFEPFAFATGLTADAFDPSALTRLR